jgi:hypothetical protein
MQRENLNSIERGNAFRDVVASMLASAGFFPETETRESFKKVDVRWQREDFDGLLKYVVEAKDHDGTLTKRECEEFLTEYGTLVRSGQIDRAWLVSKGPLSADGRALIDDNRDCKAMTFAEFQRRLLGLDHYLQNLIASFEADRIAEWYVPLHTDDGSDLEKVVREWLDKPRALQIAIVAGYGKGKSTFARHFATALAREALKEPWRRVPVLVPLGDIVDEQSLEGLLGKVFTTQPGVRGYNFGLFEKLNGAGRYVVIFDGFDEMKHGMTLSRFEANITELMRLDKGDSKVMILGRDTAFQDDYEFRSIIDGRQVTAGGHEVPAQGRRAFHRLNVRDFTIDEAKSFVRRFFPVVASESTRGSKNEVSESWVDRRLAELCDGTFDDLLVRPVHAHMLCEIATDPGLSLTDLSKYRLFDLFVHFLLDREVKKRGRDPLFTLETRRRFNRELAFWLWSQGGVSTVTLASVPNAICRDATAQIRHEYDDTSLRKELTAGCLIEKGATGTIFFGHRSLQEFLVAEHMVVTNFSGVSPDQKGESLWLLSLVTPEISSFIVEAVTSSQEKSLIALGWLDILDDLRREDVPRSGLRLFLELGSALGDFKRTGPWFIWLDYFIANKTVEFAPRTNLAGDHLIGLGRSLADVEIESQASILLLWAEAMSRPSASRDRLIGPIIASWLNPDSLKDAIQGARKIGRSEHHYVAVQDDLPLWAFLHATTVSSDPLTLTVDLREFRRRVASVFPMGFADDLDDHLLEQFRHVSTPLQPIYRHWNLREKELEKVRPYFGDPTIRVKVRPLEVVTRTRISTDKLAPPEKRGRPTLSLKGPSAR